MGAALSLRRRAAPRPFPTLAARAPLRSRYGATTIPDEIEYREPGGPQEPLVHRHIIARDLSAIFDFREKRTCELFPRSASVVPGP